MKNRSAHEPDAKVMSAADVWDDAQQIADVLQHNSLKAEAVIQLQIPLMSFLSALDNFSHNELLILQEKVEERLVSPRRNSASENLAGWA